eukprot:s2710_g8.t1
MWSPGIEILRKSTEKGMMGRCPALRHEQRASLLRRAGQECDCQHSACRTQGRRAGSPWERKEELPTSSRGQAPARERWLQVASSPQFALVALHALLGPAPLSHLLFMENADMSEAESPQEIHLAESRRSKALQDLHSLLQRHQAAPFRHGIMHRAGQLQAAHLAELRRELQSKEVEGQRRELREQEEELRHRLEAKPELRLRVQFTKGGRGCAGTSSDVPKNEHVRTWRTSPKRLSSKLKRR